MRFFLLLVTVVALAGCDTTTIVGPQVWEGPVPPDSQESELSCNYTITKPDSTDPCYPPTDYAPSP